MALTSSPVFGRFGSFSIVFVALKYPFGIQAVSCEEHSRGSRSMLGHLLSKPLLAMGSPNSVTAVPVPDRWRPTVPHGDSTRSYVLADGARLCVHVCAPFLKAVKDQAGRLFVGEIWLKSHRRPASSALRRLRHTYLSIGKTYILTFLY